MDTNAKLVITRHAKERYAERIMNKKDKLEINRFIVDNEEKISVDINKMVTYGKLVYKGKNPRKDKFGGTNQLEIYTSNTWIVLVCPEKNDVITLFKIDLGLEDEEFNKQYVEKIMNKFIEKQNAVEETTQQVIDANAALKKRIEENTEKINTYKTYIKQLEDANSGCKAIMEANTIRVKEAEDELGDILERIVSKK